jgi:hypothetical protein
MAEIVIKVNTEGGEKSLKNINDLKAAITELEKNAASLDLGSEAFEHQKNQIDALKKKYTELSKSQQQLDLEANQAASEAGAKRAEHLQKIGDNVQKFAAGLTDAFAGAFIAFGATGKDAEAFNKTLQQGVGIALGVKGGIEALISGVELAGPAFEALNTIMAANPIGAIIVLIAALAAGIYFLTKAINAEKSESEKLTEQFEKQKDAAEKLKAINVNEVSLLEAKLGLMKAQGASNASIIKAEKELYNIKKKGLEQDLVQLELSANITKAKLIETLAEQSLTEQYYRKAAAVASALGQTKEAAGFTFLANKEAKSNSDEVTKQLTKDLTAVADLKTKLAVLDIQQQTQVATETKALSDKAAAIAKKNADDDLKDFLDSVKFRQDQNEFNSQLTEQKLKDDADAKVKINKDLLDEITEENVESSAADLAAANKHAEDLIKAYERSFEVVKPKLDSIFGNFSNVLKGLNSDAGILGSTITDSFVTAASQITNSFDIVLSKTSKTTEKIAAGINVAVAGLNAVGSILGAIDSYDQKIAQQKEKQLEDQLNSSLTKIEDSKSRESDILDASQAKELANVNLTADQKTAVQNKYNLKKQAIADKAALAEYKLKLDAYNSETALKKSAFETDKKYKIAQAVISTISGALSAFAGAMQLGPIAGPIVGALLAAAVVAMGAIQISQIESTKFEAGSPPPAPKIASVPTDSNMTGNGPQAGPNLYSIDGDKPNGPNGPNSLNQPIKAYVVSQEITSSQNMNNTIARRSSF